MFPPDEGGIAMRAFVAQVGALDRAWLQLVAARRAPPWVDRGFRSITHLGGATATLALGVLLLLPAGTRHLGLVLLAANAGSHVIVQLVKRSVLRVRPGLADDGPVPLADIPDAYSFPSGHSAAAMAVALPLALAGSPVAVPALALALLVGASRVYLRVHYVTDVLMGQLLGAAGAVAATLWLS
ncbi:MAG TPA: phosphatase PAP2 family protein [Gemmatimonadales bacterium]|nr:phosphatase PAP2 family protein [Gemmatimonadales bacterium]